MKLTKIAQFIAVTSLFSSASVFASTGTITFTGAVTNKTCDIILDVDGLTNGSGMIDLGTAAVSDVGEVKHITLTPVNPGTEEECTGVGELTMTWQGPLGASGIENANGSATGTTVELKVDGGTAITSTNTTHNFDFSVGDREIKYTAQLKAGDVAGTYSATTTYAIVYE
ncbi:hypothetical protein [Vibrio cincinnatiensis]|uniref:hypothetical protein n=1 Tax=Vibrio cincinnatiensis TaxID=675 RepID=UPI001302D5B2|nr:hypothetical protein [Vibrio cincinnatiensis]